MAEYIVSRPGRPLHLIAHDHAKTWAHTLCGLNLRMEHQPWNTDRSTITTPGDSAWKRSANAGACHRCVRRAAEFAEALALVADLPRSK